MPAAYMLLKCIGKAVVKNVLNLFTFGVGGDILVAAWEYWQEASKEAERPTQVEAVAQLSAAELREEVARVVREEAAALRPEQQAQVAAYLAQIPATIRRSLRRPSDPAGMTTVPGATFRQAEDLAPLLPAGLPRFKPGDRPLPGVDWELVELLGVGGYGEVWKAKNPHFDGVAPAALKFCIDPAAQKRLLMHEAAVLNRVMRQQKHEGIVTLLQSYLGANPPCLVYEYVGGGDLAGLIRDRSDGFPPHLAAQIMQRLTEIVGHAHRLNPPIVHRDLKPANILLKQRPGGKLALCITDFGIGGLAVQKAVEQSRKRTQRPEVLATGMRGSYTPLYASPQQMAGKDPDPRDDVFALGVIWHQLLTGDLAAGRPGGEAWKRRLADCGMTPALLALLASCFEDRREDRPASAVVLAEQLNRVLQNLPPGLSGSSPDVLAAKTPLADPSSRPGYSPVVGGREARPVVNPTTMVRKSGKGRWLLCGAGLAVVGLLLIVGFFLIHDFSPSLPTVQAPPPAAQMQTPPPDSITNSVKMKFALIPVGKFLMGSPKSEKGRFDDEGPRHEVQITRPFYIGVFPVTQEEYQKATGKNPSWFSENGGGRDKLLQGMDLRPFPVENLSWDDAVAFCLALNKQDTKKPERWEYDLPTEAEWEYACRAGTDTAYFFGNSGSSALLGDYAWYIENSNGRTHEVGGKKPNPWNLFDMQGNVSQWCADWKGGYQEDSIKDPRGPYEGEYRVARGGSWKLISSDGRSAFRRFSYAGKGDSDIGFRVVLRPTTRGQGVPPDPR